MDAMKASDNLRGLVDNVAKLATWALVPLVVITMWDFIARKFIFIKYLWLRILVLFLNRHIFKS